MTDSRLLARLREAVPAGALSLDGDACAAAGTDWTRRFRGPVLAVVRPVTVPQVAEVLRACAAAGVPVVPQGGNTGLVAGAVPSPGRPAVVLRTTGLAELGPVDRAAGEVTVGAGAALAAVQSHARAAGLEYGVDLAARETATIGGTVATNAGGIRVVAHGMTRRQVLGLQAVLADGEVLDRLTPLVKDNTGYDLVSPLIGSEGTLAVITAVRLRLIPPSPPSSLALLGVSSLAEAVALSRACAGHGAAGPPDGSSAAAGPRILAAEVVDGPGARAVAESLGTPLPSARRSAGRGPGPAAHLRPYYLLIEVADGGTAEGLLPLAEHPDLAVAVEPAQQRRLWEIRERQTEQYSSWAAQQGVVVHKFDVSVAVPNLDALAERVRAAARAVPGVGRVGLFGHLLDGNLHVEVIGPDAADDRPAEAVLGAVAALGGSISAEHGVGRAKAAYLHLSRSRTDMDLMRRTKAAWDPVGLLNPGAIWT